jgi:hypothetical protein
MTSGRPSAALNTEQCEAIWKKCRPNGRLAGQICRRTVHRQLHAG